MAKRHGRLSCAEADTVLAVIPKLLDAYAELHAAEASGKTTRIVAAHHTLMFQYGYLRRTLDAILAAEASA